MTYPVIVLRAASNDNGKTKTFLNMVENDSEIEIAIFLMTSSSRIPHFDCLRDFLEADINDFFLELSSVDLIRENRDQ